MAKRDFYEILGVAKGADEKALKTAYRNLAKKYHPDANHGTSETDAKFKELNEAYDVLKDPQKRAAYNQYGKAAFQNGGGGGGDPFGGFSDIFGDIFEQFTGGGRGRQRGPQRGADLRYDMEITFEEAFHGKSTEIEVEVSTALSLIHISEPTRPY